MKDIPIIYIKPSDRNQNLHSYATMQRQSFLVFAYLALFSFEGAFSSTCERPLEVRGVEDFCWNKHVEIREKLEQAEHKVVNFAKKKLGMDVDEPTQPQKCEYYYCIFQEMKLINPTYDVPCITLTSNWIKRNVIYDQATVLLDRVQNCSGELKTSMESQTFFLADNADVSPDERVASDATADAQTRCDVAAEYMKCLSVADRSFECPIFQYP